jgi:hypothetical protein
MESCVKTRTKDNLRGGRMKEEGGREEGRNEECSGWRKKGGGKHTGVSIPSFSHITCQLSFSSVEIPQILKRALTKKKNCVKQNLNLEKIAWKLYCQILRSCGKP